MKDGQTFGQWLKWDFEVNGDLKIRNKDGKQLYFEASNGFWAKWEYDSQGNQIYFEDSKGEIDDNRTPEIITHTNGHKYQLIK